jgi:hypothetical protein
MIHELESWTTIISNVLSIIATTSSIIAIRMVLKQQVKDLAQDVKKAL